MYIESDVTVANFGARRHWFVAEACFIGCLRLM
jgi:hypothetical protein